MIPGSLTSVVIHVALFVLVNLSLRGCEQGVPVQAGGAEFHEVGLAMVNDEADHNTETPAANPSESEQEQPAEPDAQDQSQEEVVPTEVPSLDQLLNPSDSVSESATEAPKPLDIASIIGSGQPIAAPSGSPSDRVPQKQVGTSGQTTAGSPTPGPGETAFMNIVGEGESFVYLIDVSSSMMTDNNRALNLAKSQLKNSLRHLTNDQQFQVLFYSDYVEAIRLRLQPSQQMYRATRLNIQLAESAIDRVTAHGGTEHMKALERAIKLNAEVIYFLTDGDDSGFSATSLRRIQSRNKAGTQIHVIEFAAGPRETRRSSKLEQLAQQSGGKYVRYRIDQPQ